MLWSGFRLLLLSARHTHCRHSRLYLGGPLNTRLSLFAGRPSVQHNPLRLPSDSFGASASTSALPGSTLRTHSGVTLSRYRLSGGRRPARAPCQHTEKSCLRGPTGRPRQLGSWPWHQCCQFGHKIQWRKAAPMQRESSDPTKLILATVVILLPGRKIQRIFPSR